MATVKPSKDQDALLKCIHGMYWQTCNICREKDLEEIEREKAYIEKSLESKLAFDYQESTNLEKDEEDRDYDLDDMRVN